MGSCFSDPIRFYADVPNIVITLANLSICLEHGKMIEEILGEPEKSSWPIRDIVNLPSIRIINSGAIAPALLHFSSPS
jgi:hypothetical protein